MGFEVFTAMVTKFVIFCDVTKHSLTGTGTRLGGAYCPCL
jgi:hypothetical protein